VVFTGPDLTNVYNFHAQPLYITFQAQTSCTPPDWSRVIYGKKHM
jgi:hypothetical protein